MLHQRHSAFRSLSNNCRVSLRLTRPNNSHSKLARHSHLSKRSSKLLDQYYWFSTLAPPHQSSHVCERLRKHRKSLNNSHCSRNLCYIHNFKSGLLIDGYNLTQYTCTTSPKQLCLWEVEKPCSTVTSLPEISFYFPVHDGKKTGWAW